MTFDLSRNTFNPWNDYLGVVMQQGRVHLDSDWNELLAEFTRRIHAGTLDILGLSGVPSTTPGAFQILVTPPDSAGSTHVTIGIGRIYVDGILAENHGSAAAPQWDPTLADYSGSPASPLDYTNQPYVRGAALPALGTGPYLVYLDVWQRAVSSLEDPSLVDQAVGIDTTGRLQTVWQVKLLDVSAVAGGFAGSTPDSAIWNTSPTILSGPIWQTLIEGSPSLLTNGPASGYSGQENQLYRVEIHQAGSAASSATLPVAYPLASGTATFKWSRENASVATAVTAIASVTNSLGNPASQLTVQSMGRDQVLGFSPGNWIEIIDDYLELNPLASQAGELHQIDSINAAASTITLDAPVTAGNFPLTNGLTDPTRHSRIRRWDQTGTVYLADGQTAWANLAGSGNAGIPVPPSGTTILLENGITAAFDLNASGTFQTGDYWTFAARTADGSVAPLTRALPAGIDHHVCRLAILDFTASPPAVTDCRTVFQPLANPAIHVTGVNPVSGVQLVSNGTLSVQDLSQGLNVTFDSPIDPAISAGTIAPVCFVTAQLPDATGGWFHPVILAATTTVGPPTARSITWMPTSVAQTALLTQVSPTGPPVLARLTLTGDAIWALGGPPYLYLNGAGVGDGRSYADFELWFWLNSQPPVTLSASALTFAAQTVGSSSAPQPITLTNNSAGQLSFIGTGISVSGANAADFVVTNTCGTGIAAGANCSISIVFSPTQTSPPLATRTASINIAQSIDANPLVITLTGTALAPWATASSTSLSFPATVVGQTNYLTVMLNNTGTAPLSISGISITGVIAFLEASPAAKIAETKVADTITPPVGTLPVLPGAGDFSQTSTCIASNGGGSLQPGQQCTITVGFTPTATGVRSARLQIAHNAAGSPLSIALAGNGIVQPPKLRDVKVSDFKTLDKVKTTDLAKVRETILPATAAAAAAATATAAAAEPPGAEQDAAALKSFITPQERPAVDPPVSGTPPAPKPKKGPKSR